MRVTIATTHIPLKDVAAAITPQLIENKLRIIHQDLINRFKISKPRIAVAGLNPHAGESGHLGREEIDIIIPAIEKLNAEGMHLIGPIPQGLPVLKHASFGGGINVTLGLPIIRTSVDHGTALDLAGTGQAHHGSLIAAINMAIELTNIQFA